MKGHFNMSDKETDRISLLEKLVRGSMTVSQGAKALEISTR